MSSAYPQIPQLHWFLSGIFSKHEAWVDLPHFFCLENLLPSQRKISDCPVMICPGHNSCFIVWPSLFTSANLPVVHKLFQSFKHCWGQAWPHVHAQSTFITFINQRYYLRSSVTGCYTQLEGYIKAPCQLLIICMQILRSLDMQNTRASQTDCIQHLKSASTFMWLLKWLLPNALRWPSEEGEHADSVI